MRVCLTGGIACGKSLLSRYLNELGVETIDADDIVHELLPDPAERRRIAAEVFGDPAKRRELEAKIHPLVKARIEEFLDWRDQPPTPTPIPSTLLHGYSPPPHTSTTTLPDFKLRLAIIPLLFETHWDSEYDIICCVVSERETQISRMTTTRGYTREEAEARLAAQLPIEEKSARSHYVINNEGTTEELKEQARKFVAWLKSATTR